MLPLLPPPAVDDPRGMLVEIKSCCSLRILSYAGAETNRLQDTKLKPINFFRLSL